MKKVLIFIYTFLPVLVFGQTTGYLGKKFILKTNVVDGTSLGLRNLEAEYVFAKHFSISLGGGIHKANYKQTFEQGDLGFFLSEYNLKETKYGALLPSLPKATISSSSSKLTLKAYTGKLLNRAPRGFYFGLSYGTGIARMENTVQLFAVLDNSNAVKEFIVEEGYTVKNIKVQTFEASFGYQEIFKEFICLDVQLAINRTSFNTNGISETFHSTSLSAPYYGPNVYTIGKNSITPKSSDGAFTGAIGVSAYVKLGFLLF